jgi:outer membrane receptor protein involved in Fe transport
MRYFALAAALCAAAPASAQPDVEQDALEDDELAAEALAAGETIEVTPVAPLAPARPSGEEVSQEEVAALPGGRGDALAAVRSMPGVAFSSDGGGGGDLVIRGTSGTDSWYLIDGVPVPGVTHLGGVTAVMPVDMIESVELMPGGFDVEYGRATGGIVEIRTRQPATVAWRGVGDISFVHASAFAEGPLVGDTLSIAGGVRRSFLDAFLPAVVPDDELAFTQAPRYTDAQLRLDWRPDYRHQVSLVGLYSDDSFEIDLKVENPNDPAFSGRIGTADMFWRSIATWRYDGDRLGSRATLAVGRGDEELSASDGSYFLDVEPWEVLAREDLRLDLTPRVRLRAGGDLHTIAGNFAGRLPAGSGEGGADPNLTLDPTLELARHFMFLETAGYAAADLRPVDALTVTPGMRVDYYDHITDTVLQPRLAAELRLGEDWKGRASLGRFSRPHALAESIPTDLDAETAVHVTAGVERRLGEAVRAQATLFQTWLDELVVHDPTLIEEDVLDAYVSRGHGTVVGVELLLRVQREDLFGWLGYTFARSRRVDGPGMEERLFDHDQPHNLIAAASWKLGRWRLGGRFRYASGTPSTPVVGSVYLADLDVYQPIYGSPNSERLEAAHQLDLRIDRDFRFESWRLTAYLDLSNVYNNPKVAGYVYEFDYREREPLTEVPFLPSIGIRGEI